jgi:hypothetical protein
VTHEIWVGVANNGPPPPISSHHTIHYGLMGEGVNMMCWQLKGHTGCHAYPELITSTLKTLTMMKQLFFN